MPNQLTNGPAVAIHMYQALFGKAPSNALYDSYNLQATADPSAFAANLASSFANTSDAALASLVLTNLGITATTIPAASYAVLLSALEQAFTGYGPAARGQIILNVTNLLANLEGDVTYGAAATTYNNQALANFTYASNTANTVPGTPSPSDPTAGQTFTLLAGVDTVTGGAGNDTINGSVTDTWSAFDAIDGGAGTADTLNVLVSAIAPPGAVSVKNVENLNISATGAGYTIDTTGYTGLTKASIVGSAAGTVAVTAATTTAVNASATTGAGAVTVIGSGGALTAAAGTGAVNIGQTAVANAITSASVVGGAAVLITDRSGASAATGSTLTTVSLNGETGTAGITANGLTGLNLTKLVGTGGATDVTVTAAAGTRALALSLNGVDDSADGAATAATTITVTDATATSLAINAVTAKSWDVTAVAGAATAVTIAADVGLQMDALTAGVATTVGISGAGAVTITADTLAAAAVITSTNTGGVTLTQALGVNQQFVGADSSGKDVISVAAAGAKAITTGAGNDTVTYGGVLAAGGSIDAGADTDTISMTAAAGATATASTAFAATVSNFEVLSLGATAAATAINMANADGMNSLTYAGSAAASALTVTNAAANFTLTQTAANASAVSVALTTDVGTSDTVNLVYKATDGFSNAALVTTIANVENLNITTDDTDATAATTAFTSIITAAAVTSVVVSGDAGFNASTGLGATTLTSFDASGVTATGAGGAVTLTTGDLAAAATLKGGAGTNTIDASAVSTAKAMTITGGAGLDALSGGAGNDIISGGNGGTTGVGLVGNAGTDTITGGTGTDTITGGTGADTLTGGTGVDTFIFSTFGHSTRTNLDTITDLTAGTASGDSITLIDTGAEVGVAGGVLTATKTDTSLAGTFLEALDLASAADGSVNGTVTWFQYGGDTYLVEDRSASLTNDVTTDVVIKITGTVDLLNDSNLAITFA